MQYCTRTQGSIALNSTLITCPHHSHPTTMQDCYNQMCCNQSLAHCHPVSSLLGQPAHTSARHPPYGLRHNPGATHSLRATSTRPTEPCMLPLQACKHAVNCALRPGTRWRAWGDSLCSQQSLPEGSSPQHTPHQPVLQHVTSDAAGCARCTLQTQCTTHTTNRCFGRSDPQQPAAAVVNSIQPKTEQLAGRQSFMDWHNIHTVLNYQEGCLVHVTADPALSASCLTHLRPATHCACATYLRPAAAHLQLDTTPGNRQA